MWGAFWEGMKQIAQNNKLGESSLLEVQLRTCQSGGVLAHLRRLLSKAKSFDRARSRRIRMQAYVGLPDCGALWR